VFVQNAVLPRCTGEGSDLFHIQQAFDENIAVSVVGADVTIIQSFRHGRLLGPFETVAPKTSLINSLPGPFADLRG
jgi:hypothetical protein